MKKSGFTLIELLAVIVILAIIALIAVPVILNMIENARKSASKSSALGYIDAINYNNELADAKGDIDGLNTYNSISDGENIDVTTLNGNLKMKGEKPTSGTVTIANGVVTSASNLCIGGYLIKYENKIALVTGKCNSSSESSEVTYNKYNAGDLINYDPVTNQKCTSGNTCYKWRVIEVNDTTSKSKITLQMDHNIVNTSAWVSQSDYNDNANYGTEGNTNKGPITALKALETATSGWNDALKLNYTYDTSASTNNYGTLSCTNGACTVKGNTITSNLKARMITGEEVRALTMSAGAAEGSNADNWKLSASGDNGYYYYSNSNYVIGTNTSGAGDNTKLSWLLENTNDFSDSGGKSNTYGSVNYGYWTLSPVDNYSTGAWIVIDQGHFDCNTVNSSNYYGLRPVIEISKDAISS